MSQCDRRNLQIQRADPNARPPQLLILVGSRLVKVEYSDLQIQTQLFRLTGISINLLRNRRDASDVSQPSTALFFIGDDRRHPRLSGFLQPVSQPFRRLATPLQCADVISVEDEHSTTFVWRWP